MNRINAYSHIRLSSFLLGVMLLSMPFSQAVAAEKKDKQERAAQYRLQQMQQKFEQDKAALDQENATLKEQLKKVESELAAARKTLSKNVKQADKLQADITDKDTQLATCKNDAETAKLTAQNELSAKQQSLQQSEALNKQLNGEKSKLESALAEQKTEVGNCQVKNANLLDLNKQLAVKYEKSALQEVEPFAGLKGVSIENGFQDARDQAEAQLYKPKKR